MKRILVCLDHSERETFVFSEARHFAERMNARAVLLQVIVPDHGLTLPDAESDPKTHEAAEEARRSLAELASHFPKANFDSVRAGVGEAWRVICQAAEDVDASFVLVGSHGTVGLEKLFGTTAEKVVRHCTRSVVVLRPSRP